MKISKKRETCAALIFAIGLMAGPVEAANSSAPAQTTSATPTPAAPSSDPFVKKAAPPVDETGPVSNIILTFEWYTLSQADGAKLIQDNATDQGAA
jgi:hypothetical protein